MIDTNQHQDSHRNTVQFQFNIVAIFLGRFKRLLNELPTKNEI